MGPARTTVPRVTVVSAPACHFCEDADQALAELAHEFVIAVEHIALDSDAGRRLVAEHRPAMNPLVLLDGAYFSAGRLPRKRLARQLARMGATTRGETDSTSMGAGRGQ